MAKDKGYGIIRYRIMSYDVILYDMMSYHMKSYHIISYLYKYIGYEHSPKCQRQAIRVKFALNPLVSFCRFSRALENECL